MFTVRRPYGKRLSFVRCYTVQIMKWTIFIVLFASVAFAQNDMGNSRAHLGDRDAFHASQSRFRQQGTDALSKEQARSKSGLCVNSEKGGNAAISQCLDEQAKVTDHNYLLYVRSIRALLRLQALGDLAPSRPKRLSFDLAEDAWREYRDQSCASMATQWDGGDEAPVAYANCRLTVTWNHMNELADLYSDLWH